MDDSIYSNRKVTFRDIQGNIVTAVGDEVYSTNERGVIILQGVLRTLIPWHGVIFLTAHTRDEIIKFDK